MKPRGALDRVDGLKGASHGFLREVGRRELWPEKGHFEGLVDDSHQRIHVLAKALAL